MSKKLATVVFTALKPLEIEGEEKCSTDALCNKVIGTRGQGVGVWCPRELTTEHLTEASLRLEEPLRGSASLRLDEPLRGLLAFS